MKSNAKVNLGSKWVFPCRVLLVIALTLLSSYCERPQNQTKSPALSADEAYLVDSYVRVAQAHDLYSVNYLKSESLFALLDSTIDTARIANTIGELDEEPERWLLVFQSIEQNLEGATQGQESEEAR